MKIFGASSFQIASFGGVGVLILFLIINLVLISRKKSRYLQDINLVASATMVALAVFTFLKLTNTQAPSLSMGVGGWAPPFGIEIKIFLYNSILIVFSALSMLLVFLSLRTERLPNAVHPLFLLLFIGVFGVLHSGDIFNIFVYLEIMTVASYGLVSVSEEEGRYNTALYYAFPMALVSTLFLLGIFLIYSTYGTLNLYQLRMLCAHTAMFPLALFGTGMVVAALIFESALFPFYLWKTKVMSTTNVPASFFFGSVSPVLCFYLITRMMTVFNLRSIPQLDALLVTLAVITGVVVAVMAFYSRNLLEALAYGSIAQIAFALFLFVVATPSNNLALYSFVHLLNTMIFETLIFGSLMLRGQLTGEYMEPLFSTGILSSIGVPLTSGFVSKYFALYYTLRISPLLFTLSVVFVIASVAYGINAYNLRKNFHYRRIARTSPVALSVLFIFFALTFFLGIHYRPLISLAEAMRSSLEVCG